MKAAKKAKVEESGWRVGTADEFLDLEPEESALIELKLALSDALRARRIASRVTQGELARRLGSSQSRVAKMESADASVSMDLLVRAHLALGATLRDLGRTIGRTKAA